MKCKNCKAKFVFDPRMGHYYTPELDEKKLHKKKEYFCKSQCALEWYDDLRSKRLGYKQSD